jgi:hypothetical protein
MALAEKCLEALPNEPSQCQTSLYKPEVLNVVKILVSSMKFQEPTKT